MIINSVSAIYGINCKKPPFRSAPTSGKPIMNMLNELENIHLNDKLAILLKNLQEGEYVMISPNRDAAQKQLKSLCALVGKLNTVYHIETDKFEEVMVFGKNKQRGTMNFINLNDKTVRMNAIPVESYFGFPVKDGDRVWGSNLRSVLIKSKPDVSDDMANKYLLLADRYDPYELMQLSSEVHYRAETTNHVH